MNVRALIVAVLVTVATLTTATVRADGASGSTAQRTACVDRGYVAGYAHVGEVLSELPIDWSNSIHEQICTTPDGIRYYRGTANTASERRELLRMVSTDAHSRYPIAVCRTHGPRMYIVDLAKFYFASVDRIRTVERNQYETWVTGYAKRHDCRLRTTT